MKYLIHYISFLLFWLLFIPIHAIVGILDIAFCLTWHFSLKQCDALRTEFWYPTKQYPSYDKWSFSHEIPHYYTSFWAFVLDKKSYIHHSDATKLKTWPQYFQEVWDGNKTFELRFNDRNFQVGQYLILQEYNVITETYTGRNILVKITHIFQGSIWGIPNYVILSIRHLQNYQCND